LLRFTSLTVPNFFDNLWLAFIDRSQFGSCVIAVAERNGRPIAVVQLKVLDDEADLLKLFVESGALRSGTGKALLAWATEVARNLGAKRLTIEADPDAAPFYRKMGAYDVGQAPSSSIPGRCFRKPLPSGLTFRSETGT